MENYPISHDCSVRSCVCDGKISGFQTTKKYEITFSLCLSQIVHYLFIYLQSIIIDKMIGDFYLFSPVTWQESSIFINDSSSSLE